MGRTYKDRKDKDREARRRRITFSKKKQQRDDARRERAVKEVKTPDPYAMDKLIKDSAVENYERLYGPTRED